MLVVEMVKGTSKASLAAALNELKGKVVSVMPVGSPIQASFLVICEVEDEVGEKIDPVVSLSTELESLSLLLPDELFSSEPFETDLQNTAVTIGEHPVRDDADSHYEGTVMEVWGENCDPVAMARFVTTVVNNRAAIVAGLKLWEQFQQG